MKLIAAVKTDPAASVYSTEDYRSRPSVRALFELQGDERRLAIRALYRSFGEFADELARKRSEYAWMNLHEYHRWFDLGAALILPSVRMTSEDWGAVFSSLAKFSYLGLFDQRFLAKVIPRYLKNCGSGPPQSKALAASIRRTATSLAACGRAAETRLSRDLLASLTTRSELPLEAGEIWSDRARRDLSESPAPMLAKWVELFDLCTTAAGASPSSKWSVAAGKLLRSVGKKVVLNRLVHWLPLVDLPRVHPAEAGWRWRERGQLYLSDQSQQILKGLCWIAADVPDPDLARTLGRLAISAYRKVPGIGPRAVKVGNAAVYALGQMPGRDALGQLAMLRVKVKFGTAQKGIEKALTAAATREGLPRDEIEELGVPSYGLTGVGLREETIANHRVVLEITGIGDTELRFFKPDGRPQKSAPAAIKRTDELKELRAAAKDISAMLPAQRDRIDSLFLENKSWPVAVWKERYLDHPLLGVLARKLIWRAEAAGFVWLEGKLVDASGSPVRDPAPPATVRLWHPIEARQAEVLAWRKFFEERQIRQPFKQAHREIYLLTDAERATATYSNRFAAHVIRQHQFHALAAARNWKNKLRLMVDAEYPPATRPLPAHGLRAEFWVEGAGTEYGDDTNDAGAYLRLATDQVRFYREGAATPSAHAGGGGYGAQWGRGELEAGLPLEQVPPLVLSEILRDVDLFVGVCSVGNNPEWSDGGPNGVHRDYWWGYSFGDLSATGATRRDLLARLLPRLKIGAACTLTDKFLAVKGSLRTYKIHLGSGNILMEPDDQYLCIVPGSRDPKAASDVFLPFEGDRTLAIILSKAFLLAEDGKITDPTITRQIKR